jgi:enolase
VHHGSGKSGNIANADLAVGFCTGQIKISIPCQSEYLTNTVNSSELKRKWVARPSLLAKLQEPAGRLSPKSFSH